MMMMMMMTGVSGEVTPQNICLLTSWLLDHPMTDDSDTLTSPLNASHLHVLQSSTPVSPDTMVGSTRVPLAPLARDRWGLL